MENTVENDLIKYILPGRNATAYVLGFYMM